MYSFGRLNAYNPFIGGFVHESPKYGTFKRFKNTKAKIYSIEVDDRVYNEILRNINLSYCDEINLIHISEELGNRELMKQTIIEEFGVNCYTLLSNGDKI